MPYPNLFAPVTVGRMTLPHRVVLTQHAASWPDTEYPGKRYGDYLEERARGGAAWIAMLTGPSHPFSTPRGVKPAVVGWERSIVPYVGRIADRLKPYGVKLSTNFLHTGHNTFGWETYRPNHAPSPIASTYREIPRAMTKSEIEEVIDYWGRTARNLKAAGLDAIEIQTSADYLLGSFLSPALNKREDEYGGSLENRARFAIDLLRHLRAETGPDFTLGIRTSGSHLMPGGYDIDEAIAFCRMVDQTGLIDYISVIVGSYYSMAQIIPPSSVPGGNAIDYAARIKAVVNAKVIVTGKIHDPADADRVIAEGKADLVGVARGQLVDPYWIAKAREGR
ncbi:MAG: hypothetical protein NZ518_04525, partial [Dehalococcoidia bacterium]|nr:hypothetical protein [Dehalococcoidia bacterium]